MNTVLTCVSRKKIYLDCHSLEFEQARKVLAKEMKEKGEIIRIAIPKAMYDMDCIQLRLTKKFIEKNHILIYEENEFILVRINVLQEHARMNNILAWKIISKIHFFC